MYERRILFSSDRKSFPVHIFLWHRFDLGHRFFSFHLKHFEVNSRTFYRKIKSIYVIDVKVLYLISWWMKRKKHDKNKKIKNGRAVVCRRYKYDGKYSLKISSFFNRLKYLYNINYILKCKTIFAIWFAPLTWWYW